ncbi:hypothetical protein BVRB_027130, partial [Beta vulgaris subsp. vulgaris]
MTRSKFETSSLQRQDPLNEHFAEKTSKVILEIQHELQLQPTPEGPPVPAVQNVAPSEEALAPFTVQFTKLQAAFEDYKRILKLEQRAVFEMPEANQSDVAKREDQTLIQMKHL